MSNFSDTAFLPGHPAVNLYRIHRPAASLRSIGCAITIQFPALNTPAILRGRTFPLLPIYAVYRYQERFDVVMWNGFHLANACH